MCHRAFCEYVEFDGEKFFTVVLLPTSDEKFPSVVFRTPYLADVIEKTDDEVVSECHAAFGAWVERGYAVVYQHCRGQGKSTGAFVPYVHEREDGLALRRWIREQDFYNGEIYLVGASYSASLHYATSPFEDDIKGAVFDVQDSERYRLWYRNGQMRKGHANWHFGLYKSKCGLDKKFDMSSFSELPLAELSDRVLGDRADDFEGMLAAEMPTDTFWDTRFGGADARDAVTHADIPILLTTGYNDFYVGGVFSMWNKMDDMTKSKSALLVSPYDHGDGYDRERGIHFPCGKRYEQFGRNYAIDWIDHVRLGTPLPYPKGVITYYRAFDNKWHSGFYSEPTRDISLSLGSGERSLRYDPKSPPAFRAEGMTSDAARLRDDVISVCTQPMGNDVFVKGKMRVELSVSSNRPDTSFYVRISIKNAQYTYALRHDITSLCYQLGDYKENSVVSLNFCFDEYAFLLRAGECLQIDIAPTDDNSYVCHTNKKGAYYLQSDTDVAENTVYLDGSRIILPIE